MGTAESVTASHKTCPVYLSSVGGGGWPAAVGVSFSWHSVLQVSKLGSRKSDLGAWQVTAQTVCTQRQRHPVWSGDFFKCLASPASACTHDQGNCLSVCYMRPVEAASTLHSTNWGT
jgi:hypothetical protein